MTNKEIEKCLDKLREHFNREENDKIVLQTYYNTFFITDLLREIENVAINNNEAEYYSY